jgi:hypothetical protein
MYQFGKIFLLVSSVFLLASCGSSTTAATAATEAVVGLSSPAKLKVL